MKSEAELSDKEWRQMRREMSKLDFEPVPETPALLPRSIYGESEQELSSIYEEKLLTPESPVASTCRCHNSPKNRSSTISTSGSSLSEVRQTQSETTVKEPIAELPSTSIAVSPKITRRYHPQEQKRPPESTFELNDTELAALDAQMAAAQDATRRLVMGAFLTLKAKKTKTEALERMKLSAAHASDIKILQNTVDELKKKVEIAEGQRDQRSLLLDRFSQFTAKQSHRIRERSGDRSMVACFHAWNHMTRQKAGKHAALRRALAQASKRQQLASFLHWKETARMFLLQKQLQDQRDRYERRIVEVTKENQLKIQQLQQDIDDAKCQVAESQKCRRKLEEDLRLVFLRGVSALNIEALNVFGSSHKQLRKLGEQERSVLPSRLQEANSNQVAESAKTNAVPFTDLTAPAVVAPPKELTSPETSAPDPVSVEHSSSVCSSPSHSRVSAMRSISTQAPPTLNRPTNACSNLTTGLRSNTTGLRSAEMLQQHELSPSMWNHPTSRTASSSFRPSSAPLPTKKRSSSQLSAKSQVEMQYMRSTIAASAARATRPISVTRSPDSTTTAWARRSKITSEPLHGVMTSRLQIYSSPRLELDGEILEEGRRFNFDDDGEEDGIDLEGYEEYLEHLKSKAAVRPCSARVVRPATTESPQFFTTNADKSVPTRPARPSSARPRMRSTPRNSLGDSTLNSSQSRSNGMRRKRQGEKTVHARIRAVYNDVGRSSLSMKQATTPSSTTSARSSKSRGLQEADMHDEYYRLLDSESELKAALLQEQQKRVKAVAHVRRLEEVIAMKDKKIESLLHAKAVGADRSLSTSRSVNQREMAERDRQLHAITQKLKQKLAQQSQLLSSYEEAMQSLRSGVKSTNLMELEEERAQLYQELRHHQILLDQQRFERESHQQKLVAFAEAETSTKLQITKLQQENKMISYEKRKLEQDNGFLKSHVEQLQSNLTLEQRKRTYDREFSDSIGNHTFSPPTQKVMLAQALDEMKKYMRREIMASSIKREKLKSPMRPRPNTLSSSKSVTSTVGTASSAPKTPIRSTASPSPPQGPNTTCTCSQGLPAFPTVAIAASTCQGPEGILESKEQTFRDDCIANEIKKVLVEVPVVQHEENHENQRVDSTQRGNDIKVYGEKHELSSVETDPGNAQQSGGTQCVAAKGNTDQTTDEEMDEIQQRKLAAIASVLRLDIDDGPDSDLSSSDMLDDLQHLPVRISMDDSANTELINCEVTNEDAGGVKEKAMPVVVDDAAPDLQDEGGQSSQTLDDLYADDFIDTDALVP